MLKPPLLGVDGSLPGPESTSRHMQIKSTAPTPVSPPSKNEAIRAALGNITNTPEEVRLPLQSLANLHGCRNLPLANPGTDVVSAMIS